MNTIIKRIVYTACFAFISYICITSACKNRIQPSTLVRVEFDKSLGKGHKIFASILSSASDIKVYSVARSLWDAPRNGANESKQTIPKIIHHIWLGPKPIPKYFAAYQHSWKTQHPDWDFKLWTDEDVETFSFEMRDLYEQSSNYAEKSDILRCEILLRYGGVYVDIDFECLHPISSIVEEYSFFAGLEPPHYVPELNRYLLISNALIASCKDHPILQEWKRNIYEQWDKVENECIDPIEKILRRTFLTFGNACCAKGIDSTYKNIIFPPLYFYPLKPSIFIKLHAMQDASFFEKLFTYRLGRKKGLFSSIRKETLAVHHFKGSWHKSNNRFFTLELQKRLLKIQGQVQKLQIELQEMRESKREIVP